MMRSPRSFVVVCRLADGKLVVRESPWRPIWERLTLLRKPLFRGAVVLAESVHNGLAALTFSANQQLEAEEDQADMGAAALWGTVFFSFLIAIAVFKALPHLLAWLLGGALGLDLAEGTSATFHALDGAIKALLLLTYLWGVSRLPDIRRVFMYHGAEHKSIHAFEHDEELTVENARRHSRFHPRCGTSFLFMVLLISMMVFFVAFSWMPTLVDHRALNQVLYVFIKIPLMFPVAGLAYELQKLSSKAPDNVVVKALIWPGLALQRITTVEPTDDMLEVALLSLHTVLWREQHGTEARREEDVEIFEDFESALQTTAIPHPA